MHRILAIAGNTFRETVRDKILYNLILFALVMIFSALALGQLSLGNDNKVIVDLGLGAISIFGTMIAIFIGIGLVYKEIEKRTVYALLAKPVRRSELVVGKYLGLVFTLLVNLAVMTVGLELALWYTGGADPMSYLRVLAVVALTFLSLCLVTALALFFSTFSTPALSALFTLFLWIIGHFGNDLRNFGELTKSEAMQWLCRILYYVIPNFSNFQILDWRYVLQPSSENTWTIPYAQTVDPGMVAGVVFYCIVYVALALSLGIAIFRSRDFK
ncbi:MAG: ABC transporter permease [Acidobacteriota bacterium]|nr:ABC transporter permease [Acidobacteriota bacterium]